MNCSVLVLSCDAYEDTWDIFFNLKKKYWADCPYPTYLMTEFKGYNRCKTIKTTGEWTKRLREALEKIETKYVLLTLDDFFIRNYVDQLRIAEVLENFRDDSAAYNFEYRGRLPVEVGHRNLGFRLRKKGTMYFNSCQPSLHDREKLLERLQKDQNPWEWELSMVNSPYKFWVNEEEYIIDIGYYNHQPWSIKQGKWCKEIIPFFEREGIEIDYEKRGFWD